MTLKQRIFGLFGNYEKLIDTNKDTNGKGTFERYNEVIGNYVDTNVTPFVDNFAQMLISPDDAFLAMLPFLEAQAGMIDSAFLSVGNTEQSRRRIVKYIADINAVKGTKRAYKILFQLLYNNFPDLQITFDEQFTEYAYDTTISADTGIMWDINGTTKSCINYCTPYAINLFTSQNINLLSDGTNILSDGTNTLTDNQTTAILAADLSDFVKSIVDYNNPIDARCVGVYFNTRKIY